MTAPSSPSAVAKQTARQINRSLLSSPERDMTYYAAHPQELEERIRELNEEWDVERILETGCSTGSLLGLAMGYLRSPRWFLLPLALNEFVLQHALLGRCPRVPLLGRLGFRTRQEIAHERRALESLRSVASHPMLTVRVEEFHVRPWAHRALPPAKISA